MNPTIYSTGNESIKGEFNVSYYIFEKDQSFLDWLSKLLIEVFDMTNGEEKAKFIMKHPENDLASEEFYAKEINKMIDLHEKYENKGERVDIFYGKDRVYVTLRKSKEIRKKFSQFVLKTKDWVKMKKVQKMPVHVKKQNSRR